MRSITVLVIACCVLAASCFPKHAHLEKKASKLIQEAENDLDEDNGDELQYENNQEEVAEYEDENVLEEKAEDEDDEPAVAAKDEDDEPALEDKDEDDEPAAAEAKDEDDEPALESDNEAENENEEDEQKLEESDNAVAEDVDNDAELEEEDEERNVVQKRVTSDIEKLQQALEESNIPDEIRSQASSDLDKIQEDVVELRHASAQRRENLKEAIHKRIQAFRLMVQEHNEKHGELEEEEIVSRVRGDVTNLEEAVETSHLSAKEKKRAEKNLEAIARDAEEYSHSTSSKSKQLFKEAINKRMQALHMMLESETEAEKPVDTTSVISDIHQIQSELKQTKMPAKAKKAVKENLTQMLKDAEEIPAAHAERRGRLEQALKLRSKALRQQLEEY